MVKTGIKSAEMFENINCLSEPLLTKTWDVVTADLLMV